MKFTQTMEDIFTFGFSKRLREREKLIEEMELLLEKIRKKQNFVNFQKLIINAMHAAVCNDRK